MEIIQARVRDCAEDCEHLLARHTKRPPKQPDFRDWAKIVYDLHHRPQNPVSVRGLARIYHCHRRLIDRALAVEERRRLDKAA